MSSRIVKVYDSLFPSAEDIIFGDPGTYPPFPREVWAEQMYEGEVALFCVNFKSETPVREADGRHGPQANEVCRVSNDMAELERHAQELVKLHPGTVCVFRGKDGREVSRISNDRFLRRNAWAGFLGITIWLVVLAGFVAGIRWVMIALIIRSELNPSAFSLKQWGVLVSGGTVLAASIVFCWAWFSVVPRTGRLAKALRKTLTLEEKQRYCEISSLSRSINRGDRRKARELAKEYYKRLVQIRREEEQNRSKSSSF